MIFEKILDFSIKFGFWFDESNFDSIFVVIGLKLELSLVLHISSPFFR